MAEQNGLEYGVAVRDSDFSQITAIEKMNLEENITPEECRSQGFVTVHHDLLLLRAMSRSAPQVVARIGDKIVGYALNLSSDQKDRIPMLQPMFDRIEKAHFKGRALHGASYMIMVGVCVAKPYRGRGISQGLYRYMRSLLTSKVDYIITEIALRNKGSEHAHHKLGFETLESYSDSSGEKWDLVIWDWTLKPA